MATVSLHGVSKVFAGMAAVAAVNLEIRHGEFLALLGPSGCGKTTLLRLLAGLEEVSTGEIRFDGEVVSSARRHVPPERRRVGIVFQSYALWPHMTVARNIGYPLEVSGVRGEDYRHRVAVAMGTVGLTGMGERRPAVLSGGQRQRVALARCLVMEPALVLLDEPLANLDVHLRAAMEAELVDFHAKSGATLVYITHDQSEAMAMAHRIAVMDRGRLMQVAAPETLYREPGAGMVARFVGQGSVVPGEVLAVTGNRARVTLLGTGVECRCLPEQPPGPVSVVLRPESLGLAARGIPARVRRSVYRGGRYRLDLSPVADPSLSLVAESRHRPTEALLHIHVEDAWVIPVQASM